MKIVCLPQRPGGSKIELGKVTYHFKPEAEGGSHVCEVEDEAHIATLLSIREAYRDADQPEPTDDDDGHGENEKAVDASNPQDWTNKKAMAYADQVLGLNSKDKKAIQEFGLAKGIDLDPRKSCAQMIKALVAHIGVADGE